MCDIWKREGSSELRVSDLERHRDSLRKLSVRWVVLSGGEPLLHSDLHGLCSFFRGEKVRVTLLTTGLLLAKKSVEISELFDDVIVSLDGPAPVHDEIRRVKGGFRLIKDGIAAVRQKRPGLPMTARTTVQKANYRHLRDTVVIAKAIGLDSISFLAADLTSEAFNRSVPWPTERQSEVMLDELEVKRLEEEIERLIVECAADIRTGYIVANAEKLRKIVTHYRAHLGLARFQSPPCNAPWVSAVVETDGSVRPCFFHPAFGNINNSSLEGVLNGEAALEFRKSLDVGSNPVCQKCVCSLNYNEGKNRSLATSSASSGRRPW